MLTAPGPRLPPALSQVAFLEPTEPLPYMHTVHRVKIVWAVDFEGVTGEANLVGHSSHTASAAPGLKGMQGA